MGLAMQSVRTFIIHKRKVNRRCIISGLIFFPNYYLFFLPRIFFSGILIFLVSTEYLLWISLSRKWHSLSPFTCILHLLFPKHQADLNRLSYLLQIITILVKLAFRSCEVIQVNNMLVFSEVYCNNPFAHSFYTYLSSDQYV